MCFKNNRRMLSESNFTKCTEDDGSTSKFLASSHGSDDQLILRVSPEAAQRDCFAVTRDHRHHPVTNHNSVTPPCHLSFFNLSACFLSFYRYTIYSKYHVESRSTTGVKKIRGYGSKFRTLHRLTTIIK